MEEVPYFRVSGSWLQTYPGACVGILVILDAANPSQSDRLDAARNALEQALRERYAGLDRSAIVALPTARAYQEYYRRFNKTYHVQLQLESIVLKDKPIPSGAALVEAMFMAELDNLLLTAGHDVNSLRLPLTIDVAQGDESYLLLRGTPQIPKAGDMMISDQEGIVSSILYGPDQRTQITPQTRNVMFTTYVPAGIEEGVVQRHLDALESNVRLVSPDARVDLRAIYGA